MSPRTPLPQTIQIYLPQGDPAGIRMAEITTRTVRVFEIPRPLLRDFRDMPESKQVAVYFLFGSSSSGLPSCYIGQTGSVGERLKQHSDKKDFWDRALVAVSLTNAWTNTHTGYMEWQAIQSATHAERYGLHNGNEASNPHTPPPLESDCREYLETISVLLTTLGYPVLEPVREISLAGTPGEGEAAETLFFTEGGTDARARPTTEGVLVLAGSVGKATARPSLSASLARRRAALVEQGVVEVRGEEYVFVKDHLFSSPSTAGAIVVGGNVNGRITWKTADGRTFQQLEDQALSSDA
ncbi:GIY-YIG nuclease family protein [Paenarthrobacter sp. AR 02]|uniref:GIY-YIG nuclease family protein n=1 Tax=Paenarthrobacter sp. AR 02 TaxID=2899821 RepID=UPI001F48EBBC|nr:GIY-YIG nuclease family protein [Paenarthrobacter sp. AR 02]MCF3140815.1 GIY-YIG nuclease family protein [Paenarthrobacter sp. AR 02]